jgi:predicted dehydrogenase
VPFLTFLVLARGINIHLHTRMYFPEDSARHADDAALRRIDPLRRGTLVAAATGNAGYRFDIRLQGEGETAAAHTMESEDVINALVRYQSGATGVIQASTAILPGYPERTEIHGTKGTAIVAGDKLSAWNVEGDPGDDAPVAQQGPESGASDPMAISIEPMKRQFLDFGDAIKNHRPPVCAGEDGYRALQLVLAAYESARGGKKIDLP